MHYLCIEPRNQAAEAAAPDGGVISGAAWHRVDEAAETLLNDLEPRPLLVGHAQSNPYQERLPSGLYGHGLGDVALVRWLRPGEAFVTPRSGTGVNAAGDVVDQSQFHAFYSVPTQRASCLEVWVHPCTPPASFDFRCAMAPATLTIGHVTTTAGQRVAVAAAATFTVNVPSKPALDLGDLAPLSLGVLALDPDGNGTWTGRATLPESADVAYHFVELDAAGRQLRAGATTSLNVPVQPITQIDGTGQLP